MGKVNYILHLNKVNQKFFDDKTLNASHISLYNALFQLWNNCNFQTDLSINRNDVMNLAKIGSVNTYLKCLKDLDQLGYLNYKPSHNPLKGSIINLFSFDTSTEQVLNKYCTSTDTSTDTLYKLLNLETIKLLKDNYTYVNENLKSWLSQKGSSAKKPNADFSNESLNFVEWWMQMYQQPHIPVTDSQKNSWRKVYDKIRIRHPKEVIKEAITWAKTDKIWDKNFLSPAKLDKTNPEGIKYIDVFIAQIRIGKKNEIAVAEIDWEKWAKDKQAKKEAEESK